MTALNCTSHDVCCGNHFELAGHAPPRRSLHRLAAVRRQEEVSCRTVARRMHISITEVKSQEIPTTDLPLSVLHQWREILDVPLAELLVEPEDSLSAPVLLRAQFVRLMKTVTAIRHRSKQASIRQLAQLMADQLTEIMPELAEVTPWHAAGKRRRRDEYGRIVEFTLSDEMFAGQPE